MSKPCDYSTSDNSYHDDVLSTLRQIQQQESSYSTSKSNSTRERSSSSTCRSNIMNVMIPVNSKAFFRGRISLGPYSDGDDTNESSSSSRSSSNTSDKILPQFSHVLDDGAEGEIWVDVGRVHQNSNRNEKSKMQCLSLNEAVDVFRQKNQDSHISLFESSSCKSASSPLSTSSQINNPSILSSSVKEKNMADAKTSSSLPLPLPCFDIKESYDASGKHIVSECVDVQSQLNFLMNNQNDISSSKQSNTENIVDDVYDNEDYGKDFGVLNNLSIDYNRISKRLDELILLEEENEKQHHVSGIKQRLEGRGQRQSKKASVGGWKKGFLNDKSQGVMEKKGRTNNDGYKTTDTSLNNSLPPERMGSNELRSLFMSSDKKSSGASVTIHESFNEVIPIPRIGTSSVKAMKDAQLQAKEISPQIHSPRQAKLASRRFSIPVPTKQDVPKKNFHVEPHPFDQHILSEHVKERPLFTMSSHSEGTGSVNQPQKKLSMFAERRMQSKSEQHPGH